MVTTYSSTDIVHAVTAELTQHGCVLFALLSGGDYDSVGPHDPFASTCHSDSTVAGVAGLWPANGLRRCQIRPSSVTVHSRQFENS